MFGSCSATTCGTIGTESVSTTYDSGSPNCIQQIVSSSQSCQAPSCSTCTVPNKTKQVFGSCSATTCGTIGTRAEITIFDSGSPNCIPQMFHHFHVRLLRVVRVLFLIRLKNVFGSCSATTCGTIGTESVSTTYDSGSPNCIQQIVSSSQSCQAPSCSTCTVPNKTKQVFGSCSATTCGTIGTESVSTTYDSGSPNCIPKTVSSSQSCSAPLCSTCTVPNKTKQVFGSCSATTCGTIGTESVSTTYDSGSPNCIPKTVSSSQSCSAPLCSTCTVPNKTKHVFGSCSATTCGTIGTEICKYYL